MPRSVEAPLPGVTTWHLLREPEGHPGPENMARDEALLHEADRSGAAFLRLYRWAPPCLSFGRHEPAAARYDRAAIARRGLAVVRRPTGGRAVWHEHEVTYAVAAPLDAFGDAALPVSYRAIHARLAAALRTLGVPARLAPPGRSAIAGVGAGACFATSVGGEVMVGARKVVGSAQVRFGHAFLQHGSILLDGSQDVIAAVSRRPSAVSTATSLSAVLGRPVTFEEVVDAIIEGWGAPFTPSTTLHHSPPSSTPFASPVWTWRR
jgi:lipoyl(octanoyl) transferase